ncbi:hypothetical protein Tco_1361509 [Tanacetum coccineum]
MSSGLSASMARVAAMSESALRKRFWSSYESLPSVSPPDLPSWKHYRGTSELVEDGEEDDDEEDEEIEESIDSDSVSEDAENEGPTTEVKDPAAEDEGLTAGVEGPDMDDEGYGLDNESHGIDDEGHSVESDTISLEEEEEAVPGGQQQVAPVMGTTISTPLGLGYRVLRHRELALEEGDVYSMFEVGQGFRSALESRRPERVYDRDIVELFTRSGAVKEEIFSQRYRFRSLEYEEERVTVTFRVIWRPVLALEARVAEERRARLELAEVVDGIRRGQDPRGANVVLMKSIALLRLAIRSSEGINDYTASPESNCGNDAGGC